ncbi:hypothetical protein [Brachybacterium phenoliresistens]|uniref:hypothetical protein n=1 Tax=Brachybacterium phenoliresistens TaxID=396014 RepID=UPI00336C5F55
MIGKLDLRETDISSAFAQQATSVGRVAIDCETTGLDWRNDRLETVQLYIPEVNECSIVRVNAGERAPNLMTLLRSPEAEKIFHHALFDLRFMTQIDDFVPANTSCTKLAAKVIYPDLPRQRHSLQSLLDRFLGVRISKDVQTSDWSTSRLSARQLEYAIEDVAYLAPLLDGLLASADRRHLEATVRDSFAYIPTRFSTDLRGCGDVFSY